MEPPAAEAKPVFKFCKRCEAADAIHSSESAKQCQDCDVEDDIANDNDQPCEKCGSTGIEMKSIRLDTTRLIADNLQRMLMKWIMLYAKRKGTFEFPKLPELMELMKDVNPNLMQQVKVVTFIPVLYAEFLAECSVDLGIIERHETEKKQRQAKKAERKKKAENVKPVEDNDGVKVQQVSAKEVFDEFEGRTVESLAKP